MNKFIRVLFASLFVLSLGSCLKDKDFEENVLGHNLEKAGKIIELGFINEIDHQKTFGLDYTDKSVDIVTVYARLAANEVAAEDITVTLDTTGAVAKIKAAGGDTSLYSTYFTYADPSLKLVIKKGTREAAVNITTNAIQFDPSTTYGLYWKIASVDKPGYVISQNYGEYVALLGAKNDYDGIYEITGTMVDANGLYTGDYGDPAAPRVYSLSTTGATKGLFYDLSWDYPNYIVVSIATGGGANTGIRPLITFDPVTNAVVSVVNNANPATVIVVGPGSKFNPADHSIDLQWTAGRWKVTEHWEYTGPR